VTAVHRHASNRGSHRALANRTYEHRTRARYNAQKCRCFKCRRANAKYEHDRQSHPRVSADPARAHIALLQSQGIGLRSIADATDIPRVALKRIALGQPKVTQRIAEQILAVDVSVIADHALVSATETKTLLAKLVAEGYTRARLAQLLGHETLAIQYKGERVLAKTALRIRKLYDQLTAEGEDLDASETKGRGSPRVRVLSALALFDEVGAQELLDALSIDEEERDAYMQALHRLWKSGEVERLGAKKPYRYRVARGAA
jgi:hypothetical protein